MGCLLLPLTQYHHYAQDLQEFVWLTPSKNSELHALEIALATLEQQSNNVDDELEKKHLNIIPKDDERILH